MREFLIIDEVKRLIKTECSNETVKRAFIFCCFTGLRYGDVSKITWSDLWKDNSGNMILRLQISKTNDNANTALKRWAKAAKIRKRLSFHCGRHSYLYFRLKTKELQSLFSKQVTVKKRANPCTLLYFALIQRAIY